MDSTSNGYYSIEPHFIVEDSDNIQNILDALLEKKKGKLDNDEDSTSIGYEIKILLNNGETKNYSLESTLKQSDNMKKVLDSDEVVKQIRTAFTIDNNKIDRV